MRVWIKVSLVGLLAGGLGACANGPGIGSGPRTAMCPDTTFQIYFEPDSAALTDEGLAVLSAAAAGARSCRINGVRVVGLADAAGSPQANMELSEQRAAAVSRALAANGLPPAIFDQAALGQAGAMTPEGELRPLRRRADVTLDLSPPR